MKPNDSRGRGEEGPLPGSGPATSGLAHSAYPDAREIVLSPAEVVAMENEARENNAGGDTPVSEYGRLKAVVDSFRASDKALRQTIRHGEQVNRKLAAENRRLSTACEEAYKMVQNCPGNWENNVRELLAAALEKGVK